VSFATLSVKNKLSVKMEAVYFACIRWAGGL